MKPILTDKASLSAIRDEIASASSSMNMPPEPLENIEEGAFYMTDLYEYARHAHEHCIMAIRNTNILYSELSDIMFALRKKGDWDNHNRIQDILYRR